MQYRRDIDGLRALAVVPVIFFHAGSGLFSGGFVGVDVFFVISGYLITTLLLKENTEGKFSLISFYERRARRILPALFLVSAVCIPFSLFWTLPSEFLAFSDSLIATSLFSSNIFFWQSTDYFAGGQADLKPLLHTWSLAVEEQYYLIFPIFILLTWKMGLKKMVVILSLVALFSLFIAEYASTRFPVANFYLLPSRGWELLIGSLAAFYLFSFEIKNKNKLLVIRNELACLVGIFLIIWSVLFFDENTPFPGVYALVPTLGTLFLIVFSSSEGYVGRILSSRFLVGIGLISYSLYLWHLPLFVYARQFSVERLTYEIYLVLILLSFIFAYLSWRFVEKPFRDKKKFSRRSIFLISFSMMFIFCIFGVFSHQKNGFKDYYEQHLSVKEQSLLHLGEEYVSKSKILFKHGKCDLSTEQSYHDFADICFSDKKAILVWGDSNAAALSGGLRQINQDIMQFTSSACPPYINADVFDRPNCRSVNNFILNTVERLKPAVIWLHADWHRYHKWFNLSLNLGFTISAIKDVSPRSQIILVGGVPQWHHSLIKVMLKKKIPLEENKKLPSSMVKEIREIDHILSGVAEKNKVVYLSALNSFCEGEVCTVTISDGNKIEPILFDNNHLTEVASKFLSTALVKESSFTQE